jgi:hypothetical protein
VLYHEVILVLRALQPAKSTYRRRTHDGDLVLQPDNEFIQQTLPQLLATSKD